MPSGAKADALDTPASVEVGCFKRSEKSSQWNTGHWKYRCRKEHLWVPGGELEARCSPRREGELVERAFPARCRGECRVEGGGEGAGL